LHRLTGERFEATHTWPPLPRSAATPCIDEMIDPSVTPDCCSSWSRVTKRPKPLARLSSNACINTSRGPVLSVTTTESSRTTLPSVMRS
jgi:hypothetical protein